MVFSPLQDDSCSRIMSDSRPRLCAVPPGGHVLLTPSPDSSPALKKKSFQLKTIVDKENSQVLPKGGSQRWPASVWRESQRCRAAKAVSVLTESPREGHPTLSLRKFLDLLAAVFLVGHHTW
jgi:hypothetical protein